jgi:hypothetical protein
MKQAPANILPLLKSRMTSQASRQRRAGFWVCLSVFIWSIAWPVLAAYAADESANLEARVKAAFLYKFAGYVEWPPAAFAAADTPLTIGVIGAETIAGELVEAVTGRTVNERPVSVRRVNAGDSLDAIHVLFVGDIDRAQLAQILQDAHARSILTVTDSSSALEQGSIINFVVIDRRVRFEISLDSARKSSLHLSSRLLAVAETVRGGTP